MKGWVVMSSRLIPAGVLVVIGLITVKVVMALFGALAALFSFLIFTVLPIAVVGWLVLTIVKKLKAKPAYE